MLLSLLAGTLAGMAGMWFFYTGNRKAIKISLEEKQRLQQEKQIVVEFMHNMVAAVGQGTDREALFQRIIHAAILSTGAMSACIFERQPDNRLQGIAVEGLFPPQRPIPDSAQGHLSTRTRLIGEILKSESFAPGEGLIGEVAQSRRAVLIRDASSDPRVVTHADPALQVRSLIIAPILFQNELIGVLAVANPADGMAFDDTDFSLVESLAEQVGMAVHNSDLVRLQIEKNRLDIDLELAGNVQGLLLPSAFPHAGRVDIAARYHAAQKIGGDLYDAFELDQNRMGIAVADVTGKGIPASIVMAICRTHLRHYAQGFSSPVDVLRAVNAALHDGMRRDMFITMVYAVVDLGAERLTMARAGHDPPFFLPARTDVGGIPQRLRPPGMALGMAPSEIFDPALEEVSIPFGPGDTLLLFTDGLTESPDADGNEYSAERLGEAFQAQAGKGVEETVEAIMESVARFTGRTAQIDDLTLIALKPCSTGSRPSHPPEA